MTGCPGTPWVFSSPSTMRRTEPYIGFTTTPAPMSRLLPAGIVTSHVST